MSFFEHKFAVEIDTKGHTDRNQDQENEKQEKTEKHSDCKFFHKVNPDVMAFFFFFLKLVKYRVTLLSQIKKN